MGSDMTKRQHNFCVAYTMCRNVKEACITAGYTETYSRTKGYSLLKNPAIKEEIATLSEKYYKNKFQELALDAVSTLKDVLDNEMAPSSQLAAVKYVLQEAGVAGQDDTESGTIQIKLTLPKELK